MNFDEIHGSSAQRTPNPGAQFRVDLSAIDYERFGVVTAKADDITAETLPVVLEFCQSRGVQLLIARCSVSELKTVQQMERSGSSLMDTILHYRRDLCDPIAEDRSPVVIRPFRPGEEHDVRRIAVEAFHNYFGHYHADSRLDPMKCDEVYASWAFDSCISKEVADEVLVAETDAQIAGFVTFRLGSTGEGQVGLAGVAPWARHKGIYRSLLNRGLRWCKSNGGRDMVYSTQIVNTPVQRALTGLGFGPDGAVYTLHKWFDH